MTIKGKKVKIQKAKVIEWNLYHGMLMG
jgi:hypothetical protein